jgi:hypothetical protein
MTAFKGSGGEACLTPVLLSVKCQHHALTVLAHRKFLPGANRVDDAAVERAGLNVTAKRNVVEFEVFTAATEEYCFLESDAVSDGISLKFRSKVLPPSSMSKNKPNKQTQAAS